MRGRREGGLHSRQTQLRHSGEQQGQFFLPAPTPTHCCASTTQRTLTQPQELPSPLQQWQPKATPKARKTSFRDQTTRKLSCLPQTTMSTPSTSSAPPIQWPCRRPGWLRNPEGYHRNSLSHSAGGAPAAWGSHSQQGGFAVHSAQEEGDGGKPGNQEMSRGQHA